MAEVAGERVSDPIEAGGAMGWWSAADVTEVAEMLASRRARLWQVVAPADLAAWVFAEPALSPLDPPPADIDGDWTDGLGLDEAGRRAWAFAGWAARLVVPDAAGTAGNYWILSRLDDASPTMLRLTVGQLEILGLHETGGSVWLRAHAAPIVSAMDAGAADLEDWGRRGIEVLDDSTKTLAEEKVLLRCPDLDTATWLLRQPPVVAGLRLLSCWLAAGPYSFVGRYRPEIAGRAWRASAALPDADQGGAARGDGVGFDRPYSAAAVPPELPTQRSFDADAYRAGAADHDRLCRMLIAHLAGSGLRAGAGLAGVNVDLAWRDAAGNQFIAEVKSIDDRNHVDQLRLGLGQVLEYRHRLAAAGLPAMPVLVVSRLPDPTWREVCAANGVLLLAGDEEATWPALRTAESPIVTTAS
ncbi:hypothetical protein [Micromonospora carbonacea]|uniref:hypothetical protein n=1 Tax=Micromonospora carbonacea TaxID=47853 RepID=UPI00371CE14C